MTSKMAVEKIKRILGLSNFNFYEAKTEQGMMVKMEGELEIGAPIYISTEEGMIPAPAGTHKLDDGTEIEVDDEGKVSKIKMGETADAKLEEKKEKEDIKDESMTSQENFADVRLQDGTILRMEGEGLIFGRRLKKVGYDGVLSAIVDGDYITTTGEVITVVGGAIHGVQPKADYDARGTGHAEENTLPVETIKEATADVFTEAKTYDGAILESPTFDVGEDVSVIDADGNKKPAPDGEHEVELKDTEGNEVKIRITTKDGKITQRENVEEKDMEMSASQMETITELFQKAISRFEIKLENISKKQTELEVKIQKFSKEPAGSRVFTQKTINEEPNSVFTKYEAFRKLRQDLEKK